MTKIFNFALKIKGGGRDGGTCEVLRPCHPPKIWNVHLNDRCQIPHNRLDPGCRFRWARLEFESAPSAREKCSLSKFIGHVTETAMEMFSCPLYPFKGAEVPLKFWYHVCL